MAGITVDTTNKVVVVTWEDDHGDIVPAPADATPTFTSSDIGVLRLAPYPSNQWMQQIIPVAPGKANIQINVTDGAGNPWTNAEGNAVSFEPVTIEVGPGLPEMATLSVSDEPPATGGTQAPAQAPLVPGADHTASVDPNAPGATDALVLAHATQMAAAGDAGPETAAVAAGAATGDAQPLDAGTITFPDATVGQGYTAPAIDTVTGGKPPYTFTATGLPDGLTMGTDGSVSGSPSTAGDATVTVTATDADGATVTDTATLNVITANAGGDAGTSGASTTGTGAGATGGATSAGSTETIGGASLPLYTHTGTGEIDATAWPQADVNTADGQPLYHFSGDVAGEPAHGASPDWTVYTGDTTPRIA